MCACVCVCACGVNGEWCRLWGPAAGFAVVAVDATTSVSMLTDTLFPKYFDWDGGVCSLIISNHGDWE